MGNDSQGNDYPPSCIIYFHEGFSPYLPFALSQARKSNPDARIIFLGDSQNRIQGIQYEHYLLSDYERRHQEFLDCYRHFHPGHLGDERRCIERWVYLSEFLKKQKIEEFLFLDSDMLLFCDVGEIFSTSRGYDAAGAPNVLGFLLLFKKEPSGRFHRLDFPAVSQSGGDEKMGCSISSSFGWGKGTRRHHSGHGVSQDVHRREGSTSFGFNSTYQWQDSGFGTVGGCLSAQEKGRRRSFPEESRGRC